MILIEYRIELLFVVLFAYLQNIKKTKLKEAASSASAKAKSSLVALK